MKEYSTLITIPVTNNEESQKNSVELTKELNRSLENGFEVKHITSAVINNEMYVYHFLEKETK